MDKNSYEHTDSSEMIYWYLIVSSNEIGFIRHPPSAHTYQMSIILSYAGL